MSDISLSLDVRKLWYFKLVYAWAIIRFWWSGDDDAAALYIFEHGMTWTGKK